MPFDFKAMKRQILTIVLLCVSVLQTLSAQTLKNPYKTPKDTVSDEPLVVFRDRLIMDIYHTFWMNMPTEVSHMKFDPGFNVSAIWDFKIKNKPIAIGLGVGVSYYTQYSNALLRYDKESDVMKYYLLPEVVKYKVLKMNYFNVIGLLIGSMTSAMALPYAQSLSSENNQASVCYATVYPFTTFLRVMGAQLLVIFFCS